MTEFRYVVQGGVRKVSSGRFIGKIVIVDQEIKKVIDQFQTSESFTSETEAMLAVEEEIKKVLDDVRERGGDILKVFDENYNMIDSIMEH